MTDGTDEGLRVCALMCEFACCVYESNQQLFVINASTYTALLILILLNSLDKDVNSFCHILFILLLSVY